MTDNDSLTELRAWRDEFARSHGYDLGAIAAALRELDRAAGARVVRGEPRPPATVLPALRQSVDPAIQSTAGA